MVSRLLAYRSRASSLYRALAELLYSLPPVVRLLKKPTLTSLSGSVSLPCLLNLVMATLLMISTSSTATTSSLSRSFSDMLTRTHSSFFRFSMPGTSSTSTVLVVPVLVE